jgi:hypothetical protein
MLMENHMKRLVEFPLEGGGSIMIETDEPEFKGAVTRSGRPSEILEKAKQTFETALDRIKPAASAIVGKLRDLNEAPDEICVEFGIRLSAEAGAFVAVAGAEANYTVTLTWRKGMNGVQTD